MNEKRYAAAAIVYENNLHIFGGYKGTFPHARITSSTEIIHENGRVISSVVLPKPLFDHAIAKGYT